MCAALKNPSVGVAVITHNAKKHLAHCLPPLINSPLNPRVVVVNSSSHDGTVELAQELGAETLVIPRSEFNHGATRERARQYLNTDIVVMVTPDAYALNTHMLETLIAPIAEGRASVAYGRQLPHDDAGFFGSFARHFNYGEESHVRHLDDLARYGVYTFFCSDSWAAYSNQAVESIGGFPHVLLGEDTVVTAKLLRQGHHIAYVAEAAVKHSHDYSLWQEFQRHFDTGLARADYASLLQGASDGQRGLLYIKTLFKQAAKQCPLLLPYAFLQVNAKWFGYRLGKASIKAPVWFKRLFSSQDFYWDSIESKS